MAESLIETTVGLAVITFETLVLPASRSFATSRRVTSVSVKIPARDPSIPITNDAEPLLFASICETIKTLSLILEMRGFLGRNLDTGLSEFSLTLDEPFFIPGSFLDVPSCFEVAIFSFVFAIVA